MDILYTIEEKYLEALEELDYGQPQKAHYLLKEIIQTEPDFARAHYLLGCIYHYKFKNYQAAGYYYETCISLEPEFPDVYIDHLSLLITLERHKMIEQTFKKALEVKGVCKSCIYERMGLYAEKLMQWLEAERYFQLAFINAIHKEEKATINDHIERLKDKKIQRSKFIYSIQ